MIVIAALLLLLAVVAVTQRKVYNMVPAVELKRQAAARNELAVELYRAVTYGPVLRALLWIKITVCLTGGLIILGQSAPWPVSFVVAAIMVWTLFSWLPHLTVTSFDVLITRQLNPLAVWMLRYVHKPLTALLRITGKAYRQKHSGLYELSDLMDLLDLQSRQPDSRISSEQIDLIRHVLAFDAYKVRDVLRPRADVKAISASDAVGPILLDELHASGQSSFPVKKSPRSKEIVGTLHVGDVGIHSSGTVEQYLTPGVTYINETDSLRDALHAFYQTRRQLFVVVDVEEEYVGILTLENILQTLVTLPAQTHETVLDETPFIDKS